MPLSNFPYTNLHEMNLDWLIPIIQEFQEHYTGINQALDDAIQAITDKGTTTIADLENLQTQIENTLNQLQSEHIAALQTATTAHLASLSNAEAAAIAAVDTKKNTTIAEVNTARSNAITEINALLDDIPQDFQDVIDALENLNRAISNADKIEMVKSINDFTNDGYYSFDGVFDPNSNYKTTKLLPTLGKRSIEFHTNYFINSSLTMACICFFDENKDFISAIRPNVASGVQGADYDGYGPIPNEARYFTATCKYNTTDPFVNLYGECYNIDLTGKLQKFSYVYRPDGTTWQPTGWGTSDYIYLAGFKSVSFRGSAYHSGANVVETLTFYNATKNRVDGVFCAVESNYDRDGTATINIPNGVYYVTLTTKNNMSNPYIVLNNPEEKPVGIMCLGDSITSGYINVNTIAENPYPLVLQNLNGPKYSVFNCGIAGRNAATIWSTYKNWLNLRYYDVFIIMLGLNGGANPADFDTDAPMTEDYSQYADTITGCTCKLIEWIMENRPNAIIIFASPTFTTSPTYAASSQNQIDSLPVIQTRYHLPIIDVRNAMMINAKNATHWLSSEGTAGVHPSSQAFYDKLGQCVSNLIKPIINLP